MFLLPAPPAHVVILIEENRSPADIVGNAKLPNFQALIAKGALFTGSHAVAHPSLPNYFAVFTGEANTDGDRCSDKPTDASGDLPMPAGLSATMPTLASELAKTGRSFTGYAEGLPTPGYVACYGRGGSLFSKYYKRHVPWAFFTRAGHRGLPRSSLLDDDVNQPWTSFPSPDRYDRLPTVAIVVPNLVHDMHGTGIPLETSAALEASADAWVGANIMPLAAWARDPKNNALLIVTWDESDRLPHRPDTNAISTIFVGAMVKPGTYGESITHYGVLATIEGFYGLTRLGKSAGAAPITDCWIEKQQR